MVRRIAALAAALGLMLMLAAPALAQTVHQANVNSDDAGFQGSASECRSANLQPGQVLWHFIHNQVDPATDLPSTLTASFSLSGTVTWQGTQQGSNIAYNVITNMGAETFISGSDTVGTDAAPKGNLNLSHICNGGPPPDVPEAPASVLLLLTAGLAGVAFMGWRMRPTRVVA